MQSKAATPDEYIKELEGDRKSAITRLRKEISDKIPKGFSEEMNYGMIGFVVPHSVYPDGYHTDTRLPLPFINIASQKNHIAVYHMGLVSGGKLLEWFLKEYKKRTGYLPDMGKSCIRFRKADKIPYELIGELASKMSPEEWIALYKKSIKRK